VRRRSARAPARAGLRRSERALQVVRGTDERLPRPDALSGGFCGGRSFQVNSSERFRAGEVYTSPNARRVERCRRRDSRTSCLNPHVHVGLRVAVSFKTCSTELLPTTSASRTGRALLTRPRTPQAQAHNISALRAARPSKGVRRAAHTFQEIASHTCRKR
jgi:hypothetical protein